MQDDSEITALLKDYPMPEATTAYFDQALVRATHEGSRRQRNRYALNHRLTSRSVAHHLARSGRFRFKESTLREIINRRCPPLRRLGILSDA